MAAAAAALQAVLMKRVGNRIEIRVMDIGRE